MITIKDFAREQGCGESIVYRHIRNHKEELGDRVQKAHGRTWLTDEGVNYIKNLMTQHTTISEKAAPEVVSLQKQLGEQQVTIEAQKAIIDMLNLKFEQYEADKKLLAERKDKIDALEVQNGNLSRDIEEKDKTLAELNKTAKKAISERDILVNGSLRERRKLRRELKKKAKSDLKDSNKE